MREVVRRMEIILTTGRLVVETVSIHRAMEIKITVNTKTRGDGQRM
jgi:hypothetical protein